MESFFTIKQAAEIVGTTSETLRHYDRIGLVKPCRTDDFSGYRYYSDWELIQLRTIELLKPMDFSLAEIGDILRQNDLSKTVALLRRAEKRADEKIARLKDAKARIKRAYTDYEKKLNHADGDGDAFFVQRMEERVILISDRPEELGIKTLWNYLSHFYEQVGEARRGQFRFEDAAGTITIDGQTRLFAVCSKYPSTEGLTILSAGDYLCANCTEEDRAQVLAELLQKASAEYGVCPEAILHSVVVTGVLQWDYQIQLLLKKQDHP